MLVWENEVGGLTFEIETATGRRFLKWTPAGCGIDLDAEAERLAWAAGFVPVPRVLDQGEDETGAWLVTAALPGENAVSDYWRTRPGSAARAIGTGLRALHDRLPTTDCPFTWSVETRLADARRRVRAGVLDPKRWTETDRAIDLDTALARAADPPPIDRLVVCHGDACAPNTLLSGDGRCTGHVDFGSLGVADRWADLAVASWSLEWNYGPGFEAPFFAAYGVAPDPRRIDYYRLLWDLGP